jgi:Uncharacterised protein family (UPF0175)
MGDPKIIAAVNLELPAELVAAARLDEGSSFSREAAKLIALELFREGVVSLGRAAELCVAALRSSRDAPATPRTEESPGGPRAFVHSRKEDLPMFLKHHTMLPPRPWPGVASPLRAAQYFQYGSPSSSTACLVEPVVRWL